MIAHIYVNVLVDMANLYHSTYKILLAMIADISYCSQHEVFIFTYTISQQLLPQKGKFMCLTQWKN